MSQVRLIKAHLKDAIHVAQVGQPHRTLAARAARFSDSGQPAHQKLSTASATGTAAPADSEQGKSPCASHLQSAEVGS